MVARYACASFVPTASRRTAIAGLGGLALVLGIAPAGALAQGTPGAEELPSAVARFVAAMEAADPQGLADSYTLDGVLEEVGFAAIYQGRDAILENEATFLSAFTDVTITVSSVFAVADWAAAEFTFAGTYSGALPGMPAGRGQRVEFRGASILRFTDTGITRQNQFFDAYAILVQLGALPSPEEPATPAA